MGELKGIFLFHIRLNSHLYKYNMYNLLLSTWHQPVQKRKIQSKWWEASLYDIHCVLTMTKKDLALVIYTKINSHSMQISAKMICVFQM
jgi:hypothetical protein